jgi:hypothetical protein
MADPNPTDPAASGSDAVPSRKPPRARPKPDASASPKPASTPAAAEAADLVAVMAADATADRPPTKGARGDDRDEPRNAGNPRAPRERVSIVRAADQVRPIR